MSTLSYVPVLSASGMGALDYHRSTFDRDLVAVMTGRSETHTRLSVASFCPDSPRVPIYEEPARSFRSLDDSCWFLCAFFASQLRDQAEHFVSGTVTASLTGAQRGVVLVGLLGSYWNVIDPGFLLLVLALHRLPMSLEAVSAGLEDLVATEFAEARLRAVAFGAAHGAAAAAMKRLPESLRAFVPHGDAYRWKPDPGVAEALRCAVERGLQRARG